MRATGAGGGGQEGMCILDFSHTSANELSNPDAPPNGDAGRSRALAACAHVLTAATLSVFLLMLPSPFWRLPVGQGSGDSPAGMLPALPIHHPFYAQLNCLTDV